MRLLTLNVHGRIEEQLEDKMNAIVDFIAKQDVDYIALQEIAQEMDDKLVSDDLLLASNYIQTTKQYFDVPIKESNYAYQLVEKLKQQNLTYYWSFAPTHIGFETYDEGVAILSKHPFESEPLHISQTLDYSNYHTRFALVAKDTQRQLLVLSTHHSWWENGFEMEWNKIENYIKDSQYNYFAILGDFNNEASIKGEGYQLMMESDLNIQDSFLEADQTIGEFTVEDAIAGWDDHHDQKRIDYQFFNPEATIENHEVVFDGKKYPVVSDHYGIYVTITDFE